MLCAVSMEMNSTLHYRLCVSVLQSGSVLSLPDTAFLSDLSWEKCSVSHYDHYTLFTSQPDIIFHLSNKLELFILEYSIYTHTQTRSY